MSKISFLVFLLLPFWVFSQKSTTGAWYTYIGNQKLGDKFNLHTEVQYRNYDFGGDLEQLLLRTGVGRDLGTKANILFGYAYSFSESYKSGSEVKLKTEENRIFQQILLKQKEGPFFITHRCRFEERFLSAGIKTRFRYYLLVNLPLNDKELIGKTFYLSAYDELFLNTHSNFFDRNRIFGGIGYFINSDFKVELGLMKQVFETNSRSQVLINFVNTFPLRR